MSDGPVFDLYSVACILICVGAGWLMLSSWHSDQGSEQETDLSDQEYEQDNADYDTKELNKVLESSALASEGFDLLELEEYELAIQYFDDSLNIYTSTNALFGRGEALIGLGRYEEAIDEYDKIIQTLPEVEHQLAWKKKAYLLYATGKYNEALIAYDYIINSYAEDAQTNEYRERTLKKLNK